MLLRDLFEATAFHGSTRDFDTFDGAFVGTGDGALTFGWGIYLTKNPAIARLFVKRGTGKLFEVEMPGEEELLDWDKSFAEQSALVKSALIKMDYPKLRQSNIDNGFADFGANDHGYEHDKGEDIYGILCEHVEGPVAYDKVNFQAYKQRVSLLLLRGGIQGIRYLDVINYRGDQNYVIFDPSRLRIIKKH